MEKINFLESARNNILCGDCFELIKKLPDKCVDLIIMDPPYQLDVSQSAGAFGTKKKMHYKKELEMLSNGYSDEILEECCRVLKKINLYIFHSTKQERQLLNFFESEKKCYHTNLNWHKTNPIPACGNSYLSDTESCYFFREPGVFLGGTVETKRTYWETPTNVKDKRLYNHPTPKPEFIIKNFILNSSEEGDLILDPFIGSGTTAAVAKKLNRDFIGFEINENHVKTGQERLRATQQSLQLNTTS